MNMQKCYFLRHIPLIVLLVQQSPTALAMERKLPLSQAVDVNMQDGNGNTWLHSAVYAHNYQHVHELLQVPGIDINIRNQSGCTALHAAAVTGQPAIVADLLSKPGIMVDLQAITRDRPLWYVAKSPLRFFEVLLARRFITMIDDPVPYGHLKSLLQLPGIDVNAQDPYNGFTPLYWAVTNRDQASVRELVNAPGINANFISADPNHDGFSALHLAADEGYPEIAHELLQAHDININIKDRLGRTPLYLAAMHGHQEVVHELLQDQRVDVNIGDVHGLQAIYWAVDTGLRSIVRELLQNPLIIINEVTRQHLDYYLLHHAMEETLSFQDKVRRISEEDRAETTRMIKSYLQQ